jgi:NAD(P)H-hydrate epimerase
LRLVLKKIHRKNATKEKAITSDQMYEIEDRGDKMIGVRRVYMMENAGHGLADFIISEFRNDLKEKKIIVICGTGNNGGDGFVASRHLSGYYGAKITVILLGSPADLRTQEAGINWRIIEKMDSIEIIYGNKIVDKLSKKIATADIIIDGIFGTGIKGEIREPHASAIELINNNSKAYVVSVDVPSGIDPNTGKPNNRSIKADATVTFHRMKTGLLNNKKYTGKITVEKIGIPSEAEREVVV